MAASSNADPSNAAAQGDKRGRDFLGDQDVRSEISAGFQLVEQVLHAQFPREGQLKDELRETFQCTAQHMHTLDQLQRQQNQQLHVLVQEVVQTQQGNSTGATKLVEELRQGHLCQPHPGGTQEQAPGGLRGGRGTHCS